MAKRLHCFLCLPCYGSCITKIKGKNLGGVKWGRGGLEWGRNEGEGAMLNGTLGVLKVG